MPTFRAVRPDWSQESATRPPRPRPPGSKERIGRPVVATDALWEAEFRGFFWGEGCISVIPYKRGDLLLLRPQLGISQRDDDAAVLHDIRDHLGGHIFRTLVHPQKGKQPTIEWKVVQLQEIRNVLRVLSSGVLPARKRQQIELMNQFLATIHGLGQRYTPEEKAARLVMAQGLRDAKRYVPAQEDQVVSA